MRPLGEGPHISGTVVLIILLLLAAALVGSGVMIWQGCVMAQRAGRGDRRALVAWGVIAVVEVGLALAGLAVVAGPALVLQVGLYVRGRSTPPPAGGG